MGWGEREEKRDIRRGKEGESFRERSFTFSLKYIGGLSTKLFIGVCPLIYIRGLSTKNKYLCFENSFLYMENAYARESVRTRGLGYGM